MGNHIYLSVCTNGLGRRIRLTAGLDQLVDKLDLMWFNLRDLPSFKFNYCDRFWMWIVSIIEIDAVSKLNEFSFFGLI